MLIKKQRGWGVVSYSVLNGCFATLPRCQENMTAELMLVFLYDITRNMAVNHKITHHSQRNETKASKQLYLPKCNLKHTHVGSYWKYTGNTLIQWDWFEVLFADIIRSNTNRLDDVKDFFNNNARFIKHNGMGLSFISLHNRISLLFKPAGNLVTDTETEN